MSVKERWIKTKLINYNTDEAIASMLPTLQRDMRIVAAYLFGSRLNKTGNSESDIDIAVYTTDDFSWEDRHLLYGELSKTIHSDRLDLIWLNESEPILTFEVIKNGKLIFYRNAGMLNDFELKAKKIYYDHVIYLEKHRRYRGFGL